MAEYKPEELVIKLEEKARKKFNFEIEEKWEEGKAYVDVTSEVLIHGAFGNGSAFLEIMQGKNSQLIVTYSMNKLDDEEEDKKEPKKEKEDKIGEKVLVKIYKSTKVDAFFAIPNKEFGEVSGKAVIRKVLSWLKPKNILLLDSMFKTTYASFEYIEEANILKYMKIH